jgi:transposase-like protein
MGIMNELKTRGVKDILLAAVDGLTGFPDAIATVFPRTEVQLCIVHMVRSSVRFVPYKDRRAVTAGLKKIYLSPSAEKKYKNGHKIVKVANIPQMYQNDVEPAVNYLKGKGCC